jgi:hypothetical protein
MTATTTARITLADAAQDVVESARHETECYVTVNRIDGLEACIPEARAIEAATAALVEAVTRAVDTYKAKQNATFVSKAAFDAAADEHDHAMTALLFARNAVPS